ncbi:MAG: methylenetetrahydrofolate reductase [NAD(P)H] [Phenylobacterium sp.]|jgi:methylenetetrahydrofolate reductase (NADPH)|uniref:methylenetetrahydrofolate reductase [NAD(P)H] n=1 Tax=Phenylobacterium sp. TaxID=1871053 RepID=UPI002A341197|nr:methylenetetrahydrofolate reductase [NAD(P)H] [Phenylobacterium sp.]MDD3838220.1 methylenetetrahydrofolate reductase [NAD(P)H] [Phenylobacterium sp.]MDX9998638.1 methylenetetrahydrofolate reductase [NAD(P)H] [Phenylobacterium sp.]
MTPQNTALGPVARAGALGAPRPKVSFEFSPPKGPKSEASLWEAIRRLEPLEPEFVSVTYGAGGSTRERTHRTVVRMLQETTLKPAAHLTCVEATRGEVDEIVRAYWDAGIRHIVALRGDPPGSLGGAYTPPADGYANATELTRGIRAVAPFEVSVSLYPQVHPESPSMEHDIEVLKAKVDAGATRAITQFFFDIDAFLRFMDKVRKAGVGIPVSPGIMPVTSFEGLKKMSSASGIPLPGWIANLFDGLDEDPETRRLIAASVAAEMCTRLAEEGYSDFHFYTLNRADLVYAICRVLGVRERAKSPQEAAA